MMKFEFRTLIAAILFQILPLLAFNQLLSNKIEFSRYDSLLGSINHYRDYDVTHYNLSIDVNLKDKSINGICEMEFITSSKMDSLQIDLFSIYQIKEIKIGDKICKYYRDSNHVMVITKGIIIGSKDYLMTVKYNGVPIKAKKAPWDGGFVWKQDSFGDHWVGLACEGLGASSWWPCKDHWSDEPDNGVQIKISVDSEYSAVSNGKLISKNTQGKKTQWTWEVKNPINLYDVTLNIAKYVNVSDSMISKENGKTLRIDYWILRENQEKAKEQFKQVVPMLYCFESKMGAYPFYEDGYKLVETPYLGMEHQSCVAYGNQYKQGYLGNLNNTGGLPFDYIIIHESGHEWFGNNITASDNADMWIHEALTTYSESIYVECMYGKDEEWKYINKMKSRVGNKKPIQGPYGVAKEGSGDMYAKGALFFHTLRNQINNDILWYNILKDLNKHFGKRTTNYNEIVDFFNKKTGLKLDGLFSTYLQYSKIPTLIQKDTIVNSIKIVKLKMEHPNSFGMKFYYKIDNIEYAVLLQTNIESELRMPLNSKFELLDNKVYFELKKF